MPYSAIIISSRAIYEEITKPTAKSAAKFVANESIIPRDELR
jgi:hypothetical protein